MKPNRLDEIFQVKCGIPVIASLFIGMDKDEAEDKLEELKCYTVEHCYEYPADLIYQMKITFGYELFPDSECVKAISVTFADKWSTRDVNFIKNYIQEKYYHERVDEYLQKDADGTILGYMIDIYNVYYQFTICSKDDGVMAVYLKATCSEVDYYHAFNIVSKNNNMKQFIKQSLYLLDKDATSPERIEEIMPIRYGLPSFLGCFLGAVLSLGLSSGKLEDLDDYEYAGIPMKEDYGISYEYTLDELNRVIEIELSIPDDSDGVRPIYNYLRKNMIIRDEEFDVKTEDDGSHDKIKGYMQNEYISVVLFEPIYSDGGYTHLSISVRNEDNIRLFYAMQTIFYHEGIFSFFDGLDRFYEGKSDTQDARFNELRKKYNSFEEAFNDHIDIILYKNDAEYYYHIDFRREKDLFSVEWNNPEKNESQQMKTPPIV